jgi:hypothetical protein
VRCCHRCGRELQVFSPKVERTTQARAAFDALFGKKK